VIGRGAFLFGAFSWAVGVVGGGDAGFSFGAFSWTGIGAVCGGDAGFSYTSLLIYRQSQSLLAAFPTTRVKD
jgi:hypothetical protein